MSLKLIATNLGSIGTLDAGITNSATAMTVTGASAALPALGAGEAFIIALGDPAGTHEFVLCRALALDEFSSMTRGYESAKHGGAAAAWPSGTPVSLLITAGYYDNLMQKQEVVTAGLVKTSNVAPSISTYNSLANAASSVLVNHATQTVTLTGIPTNATMALVRMWFNINAGGNAPSRLYIRKDASEAWDMKLSIDPTQDLDATHYEGEDSVCIPVVFKSDGTFQYYVAYNTDSSTALGTYDINVAMYLEGFYVPHL